MKRLAAGIGALTVVLAAAGHTEASDSFWERYFGGDNPVCNRINVSGHRYCLPKERVKIWKTGEHVAMLHFYHDSLPNGKYVSLNLSNAKSIGRAEKNETVPERYLRGAIQSTEHRHNSNGLRKSKIESLIGQNRKTRTIDLSELLGDELLKSYPQIIIRDKRVTHFFACRPQNRYNLRSCWLTSHVPDDDLYIDFFWGGEFKDVSELIQKMLSIERDFRGILTASAVPDSKDL